MFKKLLRIHVDIGSNLAQQNRGDISAFVKWQGGSAAVGMPELLVGATLSDLSEA